VDLRIISLTNCNLKELIEQGKFRQDLYYRLVHRTISVPPLRERKEDIPVLINHFTRQICQKTNKSINGFTVKAYEYLQNYDWPGNIRQLENEIKSIVNLTENGGIVTHELLSSEVTEISLTAASRHKILDALSFNAKPDKDAILNLLEKNHGNKAQTARDLNMTYQGLHKRMKRLGIDTLDADGQ
jgi:two-component system response regulator HupR/HoxA